MGEPSFLCTTECGSKRRRIESASERLVVSTERTSDKQTGSNGFLGYFIRFLSPVTNLFRPSCRVPKTDVNCNSRLNAISEHLSHLSVNAYTPISEGISKDHGENEIITIDCEDSQLYSSFPTEDGGYPVENINHTFTEEKENNRRMELTATESANIIENKSDKSTETQNWDTHQENSSEDILNLESPSPQPEHSVSQQISPIISPAGSSISKDRWERRRTSSSNRHISLRRYTPFKNFSVNNKVVDQEGKERYRKFLEEAGIFKAQKPLSWRKKKEFCGKKNYIELLHRAQYALSSASKDCALSQISSREGSVEMSSSVIHIRDSSPEIPDAEVEKNSSKRNETNVSSRLHYRSNFNTFWREAKNTKYLADHRLATYHDRISLRDRRVKELQLEKRLMGEARCDDELSLEEQLRRKLTLTGYIFRPRKTRDEFPELDIEAMSLVEYAWDRNLPLNEKLSGEITRKDLLTLKGLDWLNDEVINCFMNLICERAQRDSDLPKVYAFSTFFYPTLNGKGFSSVKRWTRKIDIFAQEMLLFPIHLGAHWCLATVDFAKKLIEYFDSMGSTNDECLQVLSKYIRMESLDKKNKEFDFSGWRFVNRSDIPQQMNGSDCGMFTCLFAEYVSRRADISFCQEHVPYFRERMVYEICQKKLL